MVRIVFLLIIFILIVLISYWTIKLISSSKKEKNNEKKVTKNKSISDELLKLQNLREEGIINEEEYLKLKEDLLK